MRGDGRPALGPLVLAAALAAAARGGEIDLARQKSGAGDWKGAEAHYRAALKEKADVAVSRELAATLYNQALILGRKDDFGPTVPLLTEAISLAPDLLDARIALVLSHDRLGKKAEAAVALAEIGAIYLKGGGPEAGKKAAEAFAEARRRADRPEYLVAEGDAYLAMKDYHGALERYRKALATPAKGPGLHRRMGDAYMGLGLKKQSIESLEQAALLDTSPSASVLLAQVYSAEKDWEKVLAKVAEARARGGQKNADVYFLEANALYLMAVAKRDAKADAEARVILEKAVVAADAGARVERRSDLLQIKGLALLLLKKPDLAAAALEEAARTARGPLGAAIYDALAVAYQEMGQPARAQEARAKARLEK